MLSDGSIDSRRMNCACIVMGTQKSVAAPTLVPMKCGGVTPTTVYGKPFTMRSVPIIDGLPPKRRCQIPMAQDQHRIGAWSCLIIGAKRSPKHCVNAKNVKVVGGHATGGRRICVAAVRTAALNDGAGRVALLCGEVIEKPQLVAEAIVERVGVGGERAQFCRGGANASCKTAVAKQDQIVWRPDPPATVARGRR